MNLLPNVMSDLTSIVLGAAFLYADPRSPTTRALALAFVTNGFSDPAWINDADRMVLWRLDLVLALTALATAAFAEWLLRVAATVMVASRASSSIRLLMRLTQVLAAVFVLAGILSPSELFAFFLLFSGTTQLSPLVFFFIAAVVIATAAFVVSGLMLFLQPIDLAERVRALGLAMAFPFLALSVTLRPEFGALSNLCGQLVFLVTAIRYHSMQGQRSQFLAQFLAPEVGDLVREKGLLLALRQQQLEITAVYCDLRGFTAYCERHPPARVAMLLKDYYNAVSRPVAGYGGTIKDFAGDGILILIGAPIPRPDHADRGLALAKMLRSSVRAAIDKWATPEAALGFGIGVASGPVMAGVIDTANRLEYAAIGPAVNLASRFCSQASDGEILISQRTAEMSSIEGLDWCAPAPLKGVGESVARYALR